MREQPWVSRGLFTLWIRARKEKMGPEANYPVTSKPHLNHTPQLVRTGLLRNCPQIPNTTPRSVDQIFKLMSLGFMGLCTSQL